jgi:hypothetical protein
MGLRPSRRWAGGRVERGDAWLDASLAVWSHRLDRSEYLWSTAPKEQTGVANIRAGFSYHWLGAVLNYDRLD